jgi:ferredoxin
MSVDMVRCAGHAVCAWVFPDRISLDEWGFAHVDTQPITTGREKRRARAAVNACPRRALGVNSALPAPTRPTVDR